jgi:hypothetical protein
MPWFKVDDQLAFHPKAIAAGNAALGLWVRAGSWCAAHVTQGALPTHMVRTLGAQRRDAEKLVSVGLWTRTEEGYEFKDWADYQPTKEQVEARREADRLRQSRRRASVSHGVTPGVTPGVTDTVSHSTPSRPVPSVPKGTAGGSAARTAETEAEDPTTQAVIGVWIDRQNVRPAKRHIGHVAKVVKELLSEGFTPEHVHAGLTAMDTKGLSPSNLPSLVTAAANGNGVVRSLRPGQSTQQPSRLEPWNL